MIHPRRKPRVPCDVSGCSGQMIEGRLMCLECWRRLPARLRRSHNAVWRELRPFVDRAANRLREIGPEDLPHVSALAEAHHASCAALLEMASGMRASTVAHREDVNPIAAKLKELGLV